MDKNKKPISVLKWSGGLKIISKIDRNNFRKACSGPRVIKMAQKA
jgi:hypothetical protein